MPRMPAIVPLRRRRPAHGWFVRRCNDLTEDIARHIARDQAAGLVAAEERTEKLAAQPSARTGPRAA
jgi:hypothetical protein